MSKYYNTKYSTANNSTDAYNMGWDIEKYRDIHECEEHWQLRKAFMEKWKNNFPEERLVCLARVYTNIEFMGCRYPAPVMQQIAELSFEVGQKYKDKKKTKLQRTFVSASTAAEDRARGIKRVGGEIVSDEKPKSSRIAFVAQGETPAPVEADSDEEDKGKCTPHATTYRSDPPVPFTATQANVAGTGQTAVDNVIKDVFGITWHVPKLKDKGKCSPQVTKYRSDPSSPSTATQANLAGTGQTAVDNVIKDVFGITWHVPKLQDKGKCSPQATKYRSDPSAPTVPQANLAGTGQAGVGNVTEDGLDISWHVPKLEHKGKCTPQATENPSGPSATAERGKERSRNRPSRKQRLELLRKKLQAEAGIPRPTEQVTVKRALEPASAHREHKQPCLDHSKLATHQNCAQPDRSSLSVAVTCARTGIFSKQVSGQVLAAIQKQILLEASFFEQNSFAPTFDAKPIFANGVLKLWCDNEGTLAWLKKLVAGLSLPNSPLVVKSQSELQKLARCGIVIPDDQGVFEDPTNITRLLSYQNPWIDIQSWVLHKSEKQAVGWFIVVDVPKLQIPAIMKAERRLSLAAGKVYVKFRGLKHKYYDVPPGWDPTTKGMCKKLERVSKKKKKKSKKKKRDKEGAASNGAPFRRTVESNKPPPQPNLNGSAAVAGGSKHGHCIYPRAVDQGGPQGISNLSGHKNQALDEETETKSNTINTDDQDTPAKTEDQETSSEKKLSDYAEDYMKELTSIKCLDARLFREDMFMTSFGRLVLLIRPWARKIWNIQTSCQVCGVSLTNGYENKVYSLCINKNLLAEASGETKVEAKNAAEIIAWERLLREVVSVFIKEQFIAQGDARISLGDVTGKKKEDQFGIPVENTVAMKMMKMMGWQGGGLGVDGRGISEPIKPNLQMVNRAGLGSSKDIRVLRRVAQNIMHRYIATDTFDLDLVFNSDFSKDERAALHHVAQKTGLASRSYGEGQERFLVVKKKLNPFSLVKAVIEKGGTTPKYQVFLPKR